MNTTETIYMSKQGIKELKKSIAQLERDRHAIIMDLHEQDKNDSHDERYALIEKYSILDGIDSKLAEERERLAAARPFPRKRDALTAGMGSVVELIDKNGRKFVYTIVDSFEANPSDGRISMKSPLGESLIGKTISDTISWGMGKTQLQLVRIS